MIRTFHFFAASVQFRRESISRLHLQHLEDLEQLNSLVFIGFSVESSPPVALLLFNRTDADLLHLQIKLFVKSALNGNLLIVHHFKVNSSPIIHDVVPEDAKMPPNESCRAMKKLGCSAGTFFSGFYNFFCCINYRN